MHYLSGGERHKIYANKQFPISPMSIGYMKWVKRINLKA
jgi:hypothetical protein